MFNQDKYRERSKVKQSETIQSNIISRHGPDGPPCEQQKVWNESNKQENLDQMEEEPK